MQEQQPANGTETPEAEFPPTPKELDRTSDGDHTKPVSEEKKAPKSTAKKSAGKAKAKSVKKVETKRDA
ncbi:hypothetical protein LCGC14_1536940, partial [marine sediment metagenome]